VFDPDPKVDVVSWPPPEFVACEVEPTLTGGTPLSETRAITDRPMRSATSPEAATDRVELMDVVFLCGGIEPTFLNVFAREKEVPHA
jgi:hypothetical protein